MQQLKYDYPVPQYAQSAAANVVRMAGRGRRVLEVGAGPGSITRALTAAGCRVWALERDPAAAAALAGQCEHVFRVDLEDSSWFERVGDAGPFEVVVAADVLEHLVDPWTTLRRMTGLLAPGGSILVSLPHAGHNGVVGALATGQFRYREDGLLDRTHLRFFSVEGMQALFHQAGLKAVAAEFVIRPPQDTELADAWHRVPRELRQALGMNRFGNVYQLVCRLVPLGAEGEALDLPALPVPRASAWAPGAPLRYRLLMRLRPLARALVPARWRVPAGRWLMDHGWIK
jgi:SAM-dependent methyltransferase